MTNLHTKIVTRTDPDRGDRVFMLVACGIFAVAAYVVYPLSFSLPHAWSGIVHYEALASTVPGIFNAALPDTRSIVAHVAHIETPEPLKAVYMTSWVAGTPHIRPRVINLIDATELNAVVIDIKDDTGKIAFMPHDATLHVYGSATERIADIDELLADLHARGIYVIGRVSVFQDPHLAAARPELAVIRASDGAMWRDRRGLSWLDAGAPEVWEYVISIAREAYARGFDEINFDYVRFPSDGDMQDIRYPFSEGRLRYVVLEEFFAYLSYALGDEPFPISADLFGLTTTNDDDLGIGQVLERALPYFDYVAPMVYPSHFGAGVYGIEKPASEPYRVVRHAMSVATARAITASTTPAKLRPWLQDFDLGAVYTPEMVRAQIEATYDAGLTSWMLWDPANRYTRAALADAQ